MGNLIKGKKGNSQAELLMVMMLLIIFGVSIYTLIYSGSSAQKKIIAEKSAIEDVRIAMSYIDVKIRQNDVSGKISVEPNPVNGQDSIKIKDDSYDTWIYWAKDSENGKGKIYECVALPGEEVNEERSFEIIGADSFLTKLDKTSNLITNTVEYSEETSGKLKTAETTLLLRAKTN